MRLKVNRLITKYIRNKIVTKDTEGATLVSYGTAIPISCEVWGNSSRTQLNEGGYQLEGEFYVRLEGDYSVSAEGNHQVYTFPSFSIKEGDGFCLYADSTDTPDFVINGIAPYNPILFSLERNNYGR